MRRLMILLVALSVVGTGAVALAGEKPTKPHAKDCACEYGCIVKGPGLEGVELTP